MRNVLIYTQVNDSIVGTVKSLGVRDDFPFNYGLVVVVDSGVRRNTAVAISIASRVIDVSSRTPILWELDGRLLRNVPRELLESYMLKVTRGGMSHFQLGSFYTLQLGSYYTLEPPRIVDLGGVDAYINEHQARNFVKDMRKNWGR